MLDAAFNHIHRDGFQAASLSAILASAALTKGALYHHFAHKRALGYAVLDEVLTDYVERWWLAPLQEVEDPLEGLARLIQDHLVARIPDMVQLGSPLNNLALEMSAVDEGFRQRLEGLYRQWRKGLARALRNGQQHGTVRGDVDAEEVAVFVIACLEGAFGQAKTTQSLEVFQECMGGLSHYLTSLRPTTTS